MEDVKCNNCGVKYSEHKNLEKENDHLKEVAEQNLKDHCELAEKNKDLMYYRDQWRKIGGAANLKELISKQEKLEKKIKDLEEFSGTPFDFLDRVLNSKMSGFGESSLLEYVRDYHKREDDVHDCDPIVDVRGLLRRVYS